MGKFINAIGKQYGQLTVIRREENRHGSVVWLCHCSCGNEKSILAKRLQNGDTKSCGCLFRKPYGQAALHSLYLMLMHSAKKRGYEWNLTENDVGNITQSNCFYCGQIPIAADGVAKMKCCGVLLAA